MSSAVNALLDNIRQRVRAENDILVGISGPEGSGKSTLAIKLGMDLDEGYKKDWEHWVDNHVIVNPDVEQIQNKIFFYPKFSYILVDEGMRIGYKRDFASFEGRFMAKLFSVSRKCQKVVAICIPNFKDLDSYYRNHRVKLWFFVPERGRVMVFKPSPSPFTDDPWNIQENEKLFRKALGNKAYADFDTEELMGSLRKTKNYVMDFEFGKLPSHVEERYLHNVETLRREMDYKKEKEKTETTKSNKYREGFYRVRSYFAALTRKMSQEKVLSYRDVASIVGADEQSVANVLQNEFEYSQKLNRKAKVQAEKEM